MRKRPYAVEEEEILEIQDLKRDSALDSMENSLLKIEDCFEEATTFNKHTNTAQFYSQESLGLPPARREVEPIGEHLNRLH